MLTLRTNDCDLHYTDEGPKDGAAVVFANSLGTDLRLWDAVLPHLSRGLRLIRYDKRGHGLSEAPAGPYQIEQLAEDAAGLIRGLGLRDVVFVGLSIGGLIAQSLALRHRDLLRGIVISNSAAKIGDPSMWEARIKAIDEGGIGAISATTMERWFSPAFRATPALGPWQRMMERQPQEGYIACCRAIADADFRDALGGLDLPVQLIGGALDGATPPELVRETAALIPGAEYAQIEGAAHLPCVEAPGEYAAILNAFLRRLDHV
ncbi:MAG: 3-oxoadipate enol-lactonase [Paracoccus sp. (in: a-proteobacteria)]|nr:3-oxoadipate enol-lactonase [Paracoccus sp. (in: a-proteobacteria)]